jgi:hypothetical protein
VPDRDSIRSRFVPAVLTGLGAIFLMAGLLSYTDPVTATAIPSPTIAPATARPSGPLLTLPTGSGSAGPTPSGSATASARVDHVATRVVVPALGIDLPIVKLPTEDAFPFCNVAMYLSQGFHQPGQPGATYIFAHARTGMFLPLLEGSKVDNGKKMKGMLVQVYTSDDQLFLYSISEVRRHVLSLDAAFNEKDETLFLQTSEGPHGTPQKLQVVATPLSAGPADHRDAHPAPHPVVCG